MKLIHKLFFSNLIIIVLLVTTMIALNAFTNKRMLTTVFEDIDTETLSRIASEVSKHYQEFGDLSRFQTSHQAWLRLTNANFHASRLALSERPTANPMDDRPLGPPAFKPPPRHGDEPLRTQNNDKPPRPMPFSKRVSLLDEQQNVLVSAHTNTAIQQQQPVMVANKTIATLVLYKQADDFSALSSPYIRNQIQITLWACVIGVVLALIFSYLLARHFTRPITLLNTGAKALANRDFSSRIDIASRDEFQTLADNFNHIAAKLAHFEQLQNQWLMDISHELRTPLTILHGELSAIEDGVIELDKTAATSLQEEVLLLMRLVDDLHHIAKIDRQAFNYEFDKLDIKTLVEQQIAKYQPRFVEQQINMQVNVTSKATWVLADKTRMIQVLQNIFENNLRYSERPGTVWVDVTASDKTMFIAIEDSGPGVPATALSKLFDRLYRVDDSRNRHSGGFGLGLAICQAIISGHNGTIKATQGQNGLCITLSLPLYKA